jgi:galactokinase
MGGIEEGLAHGLADTRDFVRMVRRPPAGESRSTSVLFEGGGPVFVTRAPGRLDLMGGIADYSGSLVLELPIASATHAALQLRPERRLVVVSLPPADEGRPRMFEMPLEELYDASGKPLEYAEAARYFKRRGDWAAYVAGAFHVLARERGVRFERGAHVLIRSEVPEGKGVSSSAALEVATMQAVATAYRLDLDPREMAFLCQKVENLVACAPCGVMDQMTSACGEQDRLLALLCQPGELKGTVALPEELEVWGVDSGIRHSVGGADYGTVRTAAFMGYRMIAEMAGLRVSEGERHGQVVVEDPEWGGYLANIAPAEFEARYASSLPARMSGAEFLERYWGITDTVTAVEPGRYYHVRQATQHPVKEHARVTRFAEILESPDAAARAAELGELMYKSHKSYSACCLGSPGTDELVRLVRETGAGSGLYGAKITGGGSGGTVAVLGRKGARPGVEAVAQEYERRTGHAPLIISGSSPGAAAFGHLVIDG